MSNDNEKNFYDNNAKSVTVEPVQIKRGDKLSSILFNFRIRISSVYRKKLWLVGRTKVKVYRGASKG